MMSGGSVDNILISHLTHYGIVKVSHRLLDISVTLKMTKLNLQPSRPFALTFSLCEKSSFPAARPWTAGVRACVRPWPPLYYAVARAVERGRPARMARDGLGCVGLGLGMGLGFSFWLGRWDEITDKTETAQEGTDKREGIVERGLQTNHGP